ncbi:MAG: NAD(P)H-dependent oxidoreductase [Ktedonobacteraceae bacterium]
MPSTIHIVGFAGSLRKDSYNRAALRLAQHIALEYENVEFEIIDLGDLPLFNQDLEDDPPEAVRIFKEKIRNAEAVFMTVPEYNYSFSGVLKNAIDWASRPLATSPLVGKLTAIMGAGGRVGTERAQLHLRQVFLYLDVKAITKPEVLILNSWEKFDSEGNLTNEKDRQQIETLVEILIRHAREDGKTG